MDGNNIPVENLNFGTLPPNVRFQQVDVPQFPPELTAELKRARDKCAGRYAIAVITNDETNRETFLHLTRGPAWSDEAFVRAYQLFVAEFLKVTPDMLGTIRRGEHAGSAAGGDGPVQQ